MSHHTRSREVLGQDLAGMAEESPEAPRLEPEDVSALAGSLSYAPAELAAGAWEELESKLRAEDEAPRVSLSCTYCHDGLSTRRAQAVAYCASCLAPHHLDCFEDHARCSAPGCAETRWVQAQSSGQAPAPAVLAGGKLRVAPRESPAEAALPAPLPRRRRVAIFAAAAAASFLGLGLAAFNFGAAPPRASLRLAAEKGTVLVFERTIPAGAILTVEDISRRTLDPEKIEALDQSESPLIQEAKLASVLGRRLESRVLAGEYVRARQFRAPDPLPQGATLETYVFTHDVYPGEVLSEGDFERREVAWKLAWESPGQGLVPDTHVAIYAGRRLTSLGKGGEPLRLSHFEANPSDLWGTEGPAKAPVPNRD